ncbi:tRNA uridine-5-carboxymethylaminomethyl(34) synthesis GTPase MnmE [Candidatus Sumerlaeota bacterium]|nr:tRNA uridine-5-carboxymethylaminomethyl(34) synthesis GTPase MnmE [Candidatus Sumerlaeota bacterium]
MDQGIETICARATPPGMGAIAIVRLSGPRALEIIDRCFLPHRATQSLAEMRSHTLIFGHLVDPTDRTAIDDVLVGVMRGPHSYTGEDVVEINLHGSPAIVRATLRLLTEQGARLAGPGEFTRRAFENGQIDLAQAEAICDLITAQTQAAAGVALRQLSGQFSDRLGTIRERLIDLLAEIEARLDFPEEDIPPEEADRWLLMIHSVGDELSRLVTSGERGRLLAEGARIVLVGKPNAGKSSLFNSLLDDDRAIVTPEPGTTRDSLEAMIEADGLPMNLVDTAGLRAVESEVERLGVVRAESEIRRASLIVLCVPVDEPWGRKDEQVWQLVGERDPIVALTKCDLNPTLDPAKVTERTGCEKMHRTSALTHEGLEELIAECSLRLTEEAEDDQEQADPLVSTERHLDELRHALNLLAGAVRALADPPALELAAADLRAATGHVDGVLGLEIGEEVLDRIFDRFCIGK